MSLSKRSSKEFKEYKKLFSTELDTTMSRIEKWFDSGEKSITLKEMEIVCEYFDKEFHNSELHPYWEKTTSVSVGVIINFKKLLSSKEGLELIEKILSEKKED